jgi:hypothetical protein
MKEWSYKFTMLKLNIRWRSEALPEKEALLPIE